MKRILFFSLSLFFLVGCEDPMTSELSETIYVRHKGADMPAYIHGNRASNTFVLVLHGAGSYGLAFRDGIFTSELEERYAVVYYDQRGQSMSQGRYETPDDLVELMVEDVMALVKVLKQKFGSRINLFIMGHSWGGALSGATLTTEDFQDEFAGWINVDGAHDFPFSASARRSFLMDLADEQVFWGNSVLEWEGLKERVSELDSLDEDDYAPMLREAATANKLLAKDGVIPGSLSGEKVRRAILENNPITWFVSDLFVQPFQEARDMEISITPDLRDLRIPTLIIFGKYDVSVPPTLGADAFARLGSLDKTLLILENSAHHPHDTEPEAFGDAVVEFIERVR